MNTKLIFADRHRPRRRRSSTSAQNAAPPQQPAATTPAPQPARGNRPPPPTRDPQHPGYVKATELPDGAVPPARRVRQLHHRADAQSGARDDGEARRAPGHGPQLRDELGRQQDLSGHRREQGTFGTPDPNNPAKLDVTTSRPAPYTRRVAVYVPKQYVPGTVAPFIVGADGPDPLLFTALDNLIAQKRVPVMIAISIGNGSGDAQGSQRGLEYDTMSGQYAEFVETEVLPLVEKQYNVQAHQGSGRARDDGMQLRRPRRDVDGVVSHRSVPSRAELLGHLREPAVALQSGDAGWRVGISPNADSEQPGEADAHLDACRRPRPLESERDARRHARLGARQSSTWPRCWRTRVTSTSSSSLAIPGIAIAT